jgi:DNA-binding response OmpR family regulator
LEKRGYLTSLAGDGAEAMALFDAQIFDLVVLDLLLPGISGLVICKWIKSRSDIPIVVVSAMTDEHLIVTALDAGADDYITKPFGYDELLARLRASLRRRPSNVNCQAPPRPALHIDNLSIDFEKRRVRIGDEVIFLTKTEYALLLELAEYPDMVIDHKTLLGHVWGSQYLDADQYLHIYFMRIRRKLREYGELIESIAAVGYRLQVNDLHHL